MCNCEYIKDYVCNARTLRVEVPEFIILTMNNPEQERRTHVNIDVCLIQEVYSLWEKGIKTTGCCCGHAGKYPATIGVTDDCISKMLDLNYINYTHPNQKERMDIFIPKSI